MGQQFPVGREKGEERRKNSADEREDKEIRAVCAGSGRRQVPRGN